MKKTLFIQHRSPYSSESPQEQLDALLVCATFGQKVSILFQDDGVWQLLPEQKGTAIEKRTLAAQLQALVLYDVNDIYVDAMSLKERGLDGHTLALPATPVNANTIKQLLCEQDMVLRF